MKRNHYVIFVVVVLVIILIVIGVTSKKQMETKIGVLAPLTGDRASYGSSLINALELAAEEINKKNANSNKAIKLIIEDTGGVSKNAVTAFEKLTSFDKVPVVIGPMSSTEVLAVAPLAERKQVILFTPSASSPEISNAGDYIFRNVPSDIYEGTKLAEVVCNILKVSKIGILYINNDYGLGVVNTFSEKYVELGGNISSEVSYNEGVDDFKTYLVKIENSKPTAILYVGYKEIGQAMKNAREMGYNQKFISTAIFEDPDVLTAAGKAAEGVVFTSITFDPTSDNLRAKEFANKYEKQFGKQPDGYAATAYDALHIIAMAIDNAGISKSEDIKRALYSIRSFPGLLGSFSFDDNGDVVLDITLKTVKDGRFVNYYNNIK